MNHKGSKHFTLDERLTLERMLKAGFSKPEIAAALGKCLQSIYNEIARGKCVQITSDYEFVERYSPEQAERKYRENLAAKGPDLKIGHDHALVRRIEELVVERHFSPGAALAETYYKLCREQQAQGADGFLIFLANHGLVVSGGSGDEVIARTEEVLQRIAAYLKIDDSAYREATKLWQTISRIEALAGNIVYLSENRYLSREYAGKPLAEAGLWEHAFCPDCVVYANRKLLRLAGDYTIQDIEDFTARYGAPALIYHEGSFYILAESVRKAQEIENVMSFAARVQRANLGQKVNCLSDAQADELLNWDAEKFRRQKG